MAKQDKTGINSVGNVLETQDENGKVTQTVIGGMSDASIDAHNESENESLSWLKPFRFRPSFLGADVLERTVSSTGMSKEDVMTVALALLQTAKLEDIKSAISAVMQEKSVDLFNSLR